MYFVQHCFICRPSESTVLEDAWLNWTVATSVPTGSADPCLRLMDPDPTIFANDLQDANQKIILKKSFSVLFLFDCSFILLFKDKKSKRSHKTVRIKVFLTILLDDSRIRIWIHTSDYWIRIREAQKHEDPVDPDPEHWLQLCLCLSDALTTRLGFVHTQLHC
jgi:hypothetical protein